MSDQYRMSWGTGISSPRKHIVTESTVIECRTCQHSAHHSGSDVGKVNQMDQGRPRRSCRYRRQALPKRASHSLRPRRVNAHGDDRGDPRELWGEQSFSMISTSAEHHYDLSAAAVAENLDRLREPRASSVAAS